VLNGVLQSTPVLTVIVNASSEHGLLGIAINTETPRKVFLYYTESLLQDGTPLGNRVYRYTWNATSGLLESPLLLLDLPHSPGPNHNGGTLLLGPPGQAPGVGDGSLLYVVIGDLNRSGQLQNNSGGAAPDDSSVILRVRQDGTAAPSNPFTPYCAAQTTQTCSSDGACGANGPCLLKVAKYYTYGVRNSFGLALDPLNGRLWDTENGPENYDEINRVAAGFNSGWTKIMGPDALDPEGLGDLFNMPGAGSTYSDPEFSWVFTIAPTALVFPAGSNLGVKYDGKVLMGDFNFGGLHAFLLDAGRNGLNVTGHPNLTDLVADNYAEGNEFRIGTDFGGIADLDIGPDGKLYVVSLAGSVYRISGPGRPKVPGLNVVGILLLALLLAGAGAAVVSGVRAT
jgi:glucose/arabinose dehydrogenase